MRRQDELCCPVCEANVPLSGDERLGDEVFCTFCGAPSVIISAKKSEEDWDIEEDF
jgi:predicted amidophosphoribosyltransferase